MQITVIKQNIPTPDMTHSNNTLYDKFVNVTLFLVNFRLHIKADIPTS